MEDERYGVLKGSKMIRFDVDGDDFFFFDSVEAANQALRDTGLVGPDVEIIKVMDIRLDPEGNLGPDVVSVPITLTYKEWP